ncbi:lymphocyte cytosolic protein 2a [Denticeps clupeoides]|uniref:lymphocyte cytosolic protein 2a n=1 Tax=Denticeps clupeoides TaxID=299321 RepID=UPI0010A389FF|nr:lymphocyte cytosolic protein 2-like [Denticeps clupeoides]
MSFDYIPTRSEVMNWNPPRLADYLKRSQRDLAGCDKVVIINNISGPRFLNMSDNDLQKFPKLQAPLISRICCEINKKEEKRGFFQTRTKAPKYTEREIAQDDPVGWDPEEFDDSDDYENPNLDDDDEDNAESDYESPTEDAEGEVHSDDSYELPPSEPSGTQILPAKPSCMGEGDYIDNNHSRGKNQPPVPPERPGVGPPQPAPVHHSLLSHPGPRRDQSPQRPSRPTTKHAPPLQGGALASAPVAPRVDRTKKPSSAPNDRSLTPSRRPPAAEEPPRFPKPPLPVPVVTRSSSSVGQSQPNKRHGAEESDRGMGRGNMLGINTFPLASRNPSPRPTRHGSSLRHDGTHPDVGPGTRLLSSRLQEAMNSRASTRSPSRQQPRAVDSAQGMDPAWYVGQVTRGQAEGSLRRVNMDGAFLVRDSSKGSVAQPYTLMVLYQQKVYNIQIRYNDEQGVFQLGTGLKVSVEFQQVGGIIEHHREMPLLLIDAKNRGAGGQQKQCALTHPAGW